jgi:hypothetical protein
MKSLGAIVLAVIAVAVLLPLLGFLFRFIFGLVNFAMGLLWLALIIGAIVFLVGVFRRLMRI